MAEVKTQIKLNLSHNIKMMLSHQKSKLKASLCNLVQIKENDFKTVGTDRSRDIHFEEYSYRYTGGEHEAE